MIPSHYQGDQIGLFFAHWAIVFWGHIKKYFIRSQKIGLLFFCGKSNAFILTKMGLHM
jgi:hypothetical protein